jgi:predicted ABC-type sugar transport system permease subunit
LDFSAATIAGLFQEINYFCFGVVAVAGDFHWNNWPLSVLPFELFDEPQIGHIVVAYTIVAKFIVTFGLFEHYRSRWYVLSTETTFQ